MGRIRHYSLRVKKAASRSRVIMVSVAAILLSVGLFAGASAPVHAGPPTDYTYVCNSDYSFSAIRVYSINGPSYSFNLKKGQCTPSLVWNGYDNLRVDVEDPASSLLSDVDSYKIGEISIGWGPCHENSENDASNPPDSYNWNGIRYRNYERGDCV